MFNAGRQKRLTIASIKEGFEGKGKVMKQAGVTGSAQARWNVSELMREEEGGRSSPAAVIPPSVGLKMRIHIAFWTLVT